jgi:hypothetical protein
MLGYLSVVLVTCLTTATVALFCSVVCPRTSVSLMTSYLVIIVLFILPLAGAQFANTFFSGHPWTPLILNATFTSPFAAAHSLPLILDIPDVKVNLGQPALYVSFLGFYGLLNLGLVTCMSWLFRRRYRVAF